MPRDFKDLIVNEADGKARYNLIDRQGVIVQKDVRLEVSSEVLQQGDIFGALAANRTLMLEEDGTPVLQIDGGTY